MDLQKSRAKTKQKERAKYEDYVGLIAATCGEIRRDVFTNDLFHKNRGKWYPVLGNHTLGLLRSICRDSAGFYSPNAIEDHINRLASETPPKLLIDIPAWDGGKRLEEVARCLHCKNFTYEEVLELLKDWGARMIRKLYDPALENRILILKGDQGAGKDHLVEQLLGGLGDYLIPFVVFGQERDTFEQLTAGLVMHLQEYDRTNKTEVAILKNMITLNRTRFRGAYAKVAEFHAVRSSFIATCNVDSILRDHTGNRRYVILDLEKIDWRYPQGDSLQMLAEWKKISSEGFEASEATEEKNRAYIASQTPGNPEDEMAEDYERVWIDRYPASETLLSSDMNDLWSDLSKMHRYSIQALRAIMRRKDYGGHSRHGTRYGGKPGVWRAYIPLPERESGDTNDVL